MIPDTVVITVEEGGKCLIKGCDGTFQFPRVENCSCHICAPCSACENNPLKCNKCGFCPEEDL